MRLLSTEDHEIGFVALGSAPIGVIAIGGLPVGVIAIGMAARGVVALSMGAGAGVFVFGMGACAGLYARAMGFSFSISDSDLFEPHLAVVADGAASTRWGRAWTAAKALSLFLVLAAAALTAGVQYRDAMRLAALEATLTHTATLTWPARVASPGAASTAKGTACVLVADVRTDGVSVVRGTARADCDGRPFESIQLDHRTTALSVVPLDRGGRYDLASNGERARIDTHAGIAIWRETQDDSTITTTFDVEPGAASTADLVRP